MGDLLAVTEFRVYGTAPTFTPEQQEVLDEETEAFARRLEALPFVQWCSHQSEPSVLSRSLVQRVDVKD